MFLICRSIRATEWDAARHFQDQTHPINRKCGLRIGHPCKGYFIVYLDSFLVQQVNSVFSFLCDEKSFQVYGSEPYIRSAEDIAFHAALFVAKNGSYINYYMVNKIRSFFTKKFMIWYQLNSCFNTVPWWNKLWKDFIFIFHYRILWSSSSRRIRFVLKLLNRFFAWFGKKNR